MKFIQKIDRKLVDVAIEKGINYLWSLNKNGRWSGFPTLAGESDIWVTGFILSHISKLSNHTDAIKVSQKFLLNSRQPSGGWSYSDVVPPDADSTAWCLLALEECPELAEPALEQARTFLWTHFLGHGVSTFTNTSSICEFIAAETNMSVSGWTAPHTDVSIAAALADSHHENVPKIVSWLIEQQANKGLISSYWWRGPYYTTTLLLRVLSMQNLLLPNKSSKKIVSALIQRQLSDGGFALETSTTKDPFNTALALESFCRLPDLGQQQEKTNCGTALLQSQQENGSWAGDFTMRIPAPDVLDPDLNASWNNADGGGNSFIDDKDGLFATAMACYALDCWRQAESLEYNSSKPKTSKV